MFYQLIDTPIGPYHSYVVEGQFPGDHEELIRAIKATCDAARSALLMIDVRHMINQPTPVQDYSTVQQMVEVGYNDYLRIAALDRLDRIEANDFLELMAQHVHIDLRFFYGDQEAAVRWLLA